MSYLNETFDAEDLDSFTNLKADFLFGLLKGSILGSGLGLELELELLTLSRSLNLGLE